MKKKVISVLLATTMVAAMLAGCQNAPGTPAAEAAPAAEAPAAEAPAQAVQE